MPYSFTACLEALPKGTQLSADTHNYLADQYSAALDELIDLEAAKDDPRDAESQEWLLRARRENARIAILRAPVLGYPIHPLAKRVSEEV
jgi:hypothetical protein